MLIRDETHLQILHNSIDHIFSQPYTQLYVVAPKISLTASFPYPLPPMFNLATPKPTSHTLFFQLMPCKATSPITVPSFKKMPSLTLSLPCLFCISVEFLYCQFSTHIYHNVSSSMNFFKITGSWLSFFYVVITIKKNHITILSTLFK